jgi:hypothetical protein
VELIFSQHRGVRQSLPNVFFFELGQVGHNLRWRRED